MLCDMTATMSVWTRGRIVRPWPLRSYGRSSGGKYQQSMPRNAGREDGSRRGDSDSGSKRSVTSSKATDVADVGACY
jgi:hypothetical protein